MGGGWGFSTVLYTRGLPTDFVVVAKFVDVEKESHIVFTHCFKSYKHKCRTLPSPPSAAQKILLILGDLVYKSLPTGSHPEPGESSSQPRIPWLYDPYLYYPPIYEFQIFSPRPTALWHFVTC
jgi:hypothetical protein